jgi:4-hydroxy-tetrahydrodipicolinate reductase
VRIGIFGKGRLGSAIAKLAATDVAWQVARERPPGEVVDCAIEASAGEAVTERLDWALETGTPLVIGSTGWSLPDLAERVGTRIGVVVAPNFSLTVALYVRLTRVLARFAAKDQARDPYVLEHHHARKRDVPSGTARLLAEAILQECPRKTSWVVPHGEGVLRPGDLSVSAVRAGTTYSSHVVGLDAPGEVIELHHAARDASPYAEGALAAARWLQGRRGLHTMDAVARDILDPLFEEGEP